MEQYWRFNGLKRQKRLRKGGRELEAGAEFEERKGKEEHGRK